MPDTDVREPERGTPGTTAAPLPAVAIEPFSRWVIAVGGLLFAVLMAVSDRYGFHHDELYFLDCARHLQASYVDQPVLTPLLGRVSLALFGLSLVGLHLWPALAAGATVLLAGLTAREFGGTRRAQLLTAVAAATMPAVYGADHLFGPTAFDILSWSALAFVVARIGRTGDLRWWVPAGAILGVGAENKHLIGFFGIAIFLGALLSGGRRMVLNRWFLAGAAIAVALEVPDIWWQAQHQWATIAMTESLNHKNGGPGNILAWLAGQLVVLGVVRIWPAGAGLRFLWRSGRPLWRALVWAYGLLFVTFMITTGAQSYYLAGTYPILLAAGFVALDGWLTARQARLRRLVAGLAISGLLFVPVTLPMLPIADMGWTGGTNGVLTQEVGWPQLVGTVQSVWFSLPARQRANAVIFTADYGEAGAINELGRGTGLPTAVSGHNTDWWWGPGNPRASTVVVVAPTPSVAGDLAPELRQNFRTVREAATLSNPWHIRNENYGGHVYVCSGPLRPWGQMWPSLRHYD